MDCFETPKPICLVPLQISNISSIDSFDIHSFLTLKSMLDLVFSLLLRYLFLLFLGTLVAEMLFLTFQQHLFRLTRRLGASRQRFVEGMDYSLVFLNGRKKRDVHCPPKQSLLLQGKFHWVELRSTHSVLPGLVKF